ncbi:MAG: hypothetical protein L0H36_00860 [bacterium]|nr:hypothetical protein [bacterium]MDN5835167.1 hypothetical protein [bacterium]
MQYKHQPQFNSRRTTRQMGRNQNTVRFVSQIKLGPVTHTVLVALMITVLGLIYLTQATRATGYDYQSQKIEDKIAELSTKKSDLEVENARLTALKTISSSKVASDMSKPDHTNYVKD